jgi:hypothetical protein
MLRRLTRASHPLPPFASEAMKKQQDMEGFDFRDFHKQQMVTVASETVEWGWPARGAWIDHTLEFFRIYRDIRFALSMAILRESILDSINRLLERVGPPFHLVLNGLPTANEIESYLIGMQNGEMTFDEALQAIRI